MTGRRPEITEVWAAIDLYLSIAYEGQIPSAIQKRLRTLRLLEGEDFWQSDLFERDSAAVPTRYGLRLGNEFYPHMKLSIDARPDGAGFLFRADTHDQHCCPVPNSREFDQFCELMSRNQRLAAAIEIAWAKHAIPTFKTYLKIDLLRRANLVDGGRPPQRGVALNAAVPCGQIANGRHFSSELIRSRPCDVV